MKRKLHELAHARAGDKGDTLTLSLFALREADFPLLVAQVTAAAVQRHLAHIVRGEVRRYELPNLHALQFVCERTLDTGVTTSLALDPHGKSLSYALLELRSNPQLSRRDASGAPGPPKGDLRHAPVAAARRSTLLLPRPHGIRPGIGRPVLC